MSTIIRRPAIAMLGLLALIASLMLPAIASAEVPSDEVPDSLKSAIQAYIESKGHDYAGFCRDIDQSANLGKYCAFVQSMNDNSAEVTYGPVASDEISAVRFYKQGDTWTAVQIPDELRAAVKAYIEGKGHQYAGLCREIDQSASIGKHCAFIEMVSATKAKVSYGRVASDELTAVTFEKQGSTWSAATNVNNPTTPSPPNTGSGMDSSDGNGMSLAIAGSLVAVVALFGVATGVAVRRR